MEQLLIASVMFGPPAAMLLVAQATRFGVSGWIAAFGVLAIMVAATFWAWRGVTLTYALDVEAEGAGALAFALMSGAVWLLGALVSLGFIVHWGLARRVAA